MANPNDFLCGQKAQLEQQILAYQALADDFAEGRVQSFMLDTGQTKEQVTKANVRVLHDTIDALYNRYIILCNRCGGGASAIQRPAW